METIIIVVESADNNLSAYVKDIYGIAVTGKKIVGL